MCPFTVTIDFVIPFGPHFPVFFGGGGFHTPSCHPRTSSLDLYSLWVFSPRTVHKHVTPSSSDAPPPPFTPPLPLPPSLARSISVLCSKTGALRQQEMGSRDNRMEESVEGSLMLAPRTQACWKQLLYNLTFNIMWHAHTIQIQGFIFARFWNTNPSNFCQNDTRILTLWYTTWVKSDPAQFFFYIFAVDQFHHSVFQVFPN